LSCWRAGLRHGDHVRVTYILTFSARGVRPLGFVWGWLARLVFSFLVGSFHRSQIKCAYYESSISNCTFIVPIRLKRCVAFSACTMSFVYLILAAPTTKLQTTNYQTTIVASLLHSLVERNKQKQTMQLSLCCASIDPAIQYRNKELVGWHIGESCGQTEENRRRVLDALHRLNMDGAE